MNSGASREQLLRHEALYNDAQNAAQLGIWEWRLNADQVTWSLGLYRIYALDPARHSPSYEAYLRVLHPEDRERVRGVIERAAAEGQDFSHDERIFRPDGSIRSLHTWGHALVDKRGRTTGLIGVCQDITERVLAEETAKRGYALLQAVVEGSPNAIFLKDMDGRFLMVNASGAAMVGSTPERLIAKTAADLFPPETLEEISRHEAAALRSRRPEVYDLLVESGGKQRVLAVTETAWVDGSGRMNGIIGMAQDITERKAIERQRDELLASERQARSESEKAQSRLKFLHDAEEALSSPFDFDEIIERLLAAAVPEFADWCSIFIAAEDGHLRLATAVHRDAQSARVLKAFLRETPPSPVEPRGVAAVIGSGETLIVPDVTLANIASVSYDPAYERLLQVFGAASSLILPLKVRGKIVGGASFFYGRSGRRYLESDRALAEEFSLHAALAIERFLLHDEIRRAIPIGREESAGPAASLRLSMDALAAAIGGGLADNAAAQLTAARSELDQLETLMEKLIAHASLCWTAGRVNEKTDPLPGRPATSSSAP